MNLEELGFYSGVNYLKRDDELSGSQTVSMTGTEEQTITVNHNLGYIPFVTVGANINDGSTIWSSNSTPLLSGQVGVERPTFTWWVDENTLTIYLTNNQIDTNISGDRTVYWAIYLDYGGTE